MSKSLNLLIIFVISIGFLSALESKHSKTPQAIDKRNKLEKKTINLFGQDYANEVIPMFHYFGSVVGGLVKGGAGIDLNDPLFCLRNGGKLIKA